MGIIRLSSTPAPAPAPVTTPGSAPLESSFSSIPPKEGKRKTRLPTIISTILLPPLLCICLALTLIPLLFPNTNNQSLSYFTIRPIGAERGSSAIAINPDDIANHHSGEANLHKRGDDVLKDDVLEVFHMIGGMGNSIEWMGRDGPSFWVGILQICSKSSPNEKVNCTSSSQAENHARLLPSSLQSFLLSLPSSPPTPILLFISAILLLLASLVFIAGLIPWKCSISFNCLHRKPHLEANPHWARNPYEYSSGGTESVENLVPEHTNRRKRIKRTRPHMFFFCLVVVALGLTAGSLIQLKIVREAQSNWNSDRAGDVGLVFDVGMLTYVTPILPICLLLILLIGASPSIYSYIANTFHTCPADHDSETSDPDMPEIKIRSPQAEVGRSWDQTPIVNPSPVHIASSSKLVKPIRDVDRTSKGSSTVGKAI